MTKTDFLPALFVEPGPQAGDSHLTSEITERKRASEQIAELQREQKRARTAAATREQFARQPRPFLEDVEDQTTQPGGEAQATSNAAPSRAVTDSEQGSRNVQSGKLQVPTEALKRLRSDIIAGKPGARAAASVQPANSTVDVIEVEDDDDNDDDNGVPPGKPLHPRAIFRFQSRLIICRSSHSSPNQHHKTA